VKEILNTDIWSLHRPNNWVVITTNGYVNQKGKAVMGRGVALQAAQKFPAIPMFLANAIKTFGNHVHVFHHPFRLISFPVKHHWMQTADLDLIRRSTEELKEAWNQVSEETGGRIYLPRPGCNNGRLNWKDVKPILEPILDDRFTVVEIKRE